MAKSYTEKDNGRIQLIVSTGSGKDRKRAYKTIDAPKGRARDREKAIIAALDDFEKEVISPGDILSGVVPTLDDYFKSWLDLKRDNLSPTTLDTYLATSRRILDTFGKYRLNQISPMMIQSFYKSLRKELAPRTIRDYHTLLSVLFSDALRLDVIDKNIMLKVATPKVPKTSPAVLTMEEAHRLITLLEDEPLKIRGTFLLALVGGLRRSEIAGLNYQDYNPSKRSLTVSRAYVATSEGPVLKSTKSGRVSEKIVPKVLGDVLSAMVLSAKKDEIFYRKPEPHAFALLRQPQGDRLYPSTPSQWWGSFSKAHGFNLRFHDLRHSCASLLIAMGVDVATVSRYLDHSRVSTTLDTYTHFILKADDEIGGAFAEITKTASQD